jgi:glycosyltransferase involved in cell wall biosynthesis
VTDRSRAVGRGVRFYSYLEPSGYGMAALAHLRGLVNAGTGVEWHIVERGHEPDIVTRPAAAAAPTPWADGDRALADLPALRAATALPLACDHVVAFTVPEHWPHLFEPGRRNVGCTVWETDRLPPHWRDLLDRAHGIVVPCAQNAAVVAAAGVTTPVHVVPHIRRHAWNDFTVAELDAARHEFAVDGASTLFYSINAWDPRKDVPSLLYAFASAFTRDDPVALIVKTGASGFGPPPLYARRDVATLAREALDAIGAALGRAPPRVTVLPYELSGRGVDLVHRLGQVYVSTTHGEGWGLGAFDAATLGRPVLMTGWGGHRDWLGDDAAWPGALPWRMTRVPVFPPDRPSYWRSQRWANVDIAAAAQVFRAYVARPQAHRRAANAIAERIAGAYAEPRVAAAFAAAVFADG